MPLLKYRQDGNEVREFTTAEYAQQELDAVEYAAEAEAVAARAVAREALLARLGITAEEAQLLLGGI